MKIITRLPKKDDKRHIYLTNNGWMPLKEPGNIFLAILLSIPLMVLAAFISIAIIRAFYNISLASYGLDIAAGNIGVEFNLLYILGIIILIIVHETIHIVLIPNFLKSDKTYVGIVPLGGFVYTEEIITKARHLTITILPFILISIMLPAVLGLLGMLNPFIIFLIVLNSIGSGMDILNFIIVLKQVPSKACLTNNGMDTYWKKHVIEKDITVGNVF